MSTNLLKAIMNIKKLGNYNLNEIYPPNSEMITVNSIQNIGESLETFIKDSFCDSFGEVNKVDFHSKYFSYRGNANNPPDAMLKGSDAIEIKKIGSPTRSIQLNSSHPKNRFHNHDPSITRSCIECENWVSKDMLYAFGILNNDKLHSLAFIYGDCFAADEEVYLKIKNHLVDTIKELPDSRQTNELGRVNNVDPLGITNLRIRGMWIMKNPYKIFESIFKYSDDDVFSLYALMTRDKFDSFDENDKKLIIEDTNIEYSNVKILNPNNPVKQLDAVLIKVIL